MLGKFSCAIEKRTTPHGVNQRSVMLMTVAHFGKASLATQPTATTKTYSKKYMNTTLRVMLGLSRQEQSKHCIASKLN